MKKRNGLKREKVYKKVYIKILYGIMPEIERHFYKSFTLE